MSALASLPVLFAQAAPQGPSSLWHRLLVWLIIYGDPAVVPLDPRIPAAVTGLIVWLKVISLFCLLGWVVSWVTSALKERTVARGDWLDVAALVALIGGVGAMALRVMVATKRIESALMIGGVPLATLIGLSCGAVVFLWIEAALWRTVRKLGRRSDLAVLAGVHVALLIGAGLGLYLQRSGFLNLPDAKQAPTWKDGIIYGARLSATYMGYVVLARVLGLILREVVAVRWRRLYSIARNSVVESNRRMWAPWVVLTVFLVVLAFTHWFLTPPRPAEMGRLFVGTLALLCSLLLTAMVTILSPLSLPTDIQMQTIYTVVSKPVRRIELIWGRMLGFMAIVTVLVLAFGGISLAYLWRTVNGTIEATVAAADKARKEGRITEANQLEEQAEQIRTRMAAREPIKGSLTFLDSRGNPHLRGIDVGQEQSMREPRSHIEGGTPAAAIWHFGVVPDPYNPNIPLDRRIPVDRLLVPNTIEWLLNRSYEIQAQIATDEREQAQGKASASRLKELSGRIARNRDELKAVNASYESQKGQSADLGKRAAAAEAAGRGGEAESLRRQAAELHSPPVVVEMTFNIFRTTKGRIGEPVIGEIVVTNPHVGGKPYRNVFAIREYYTNKQRIPASTLAGSMGDLKIEIRCDTPTQYLGMSESDLYILANAGRFDVNYMKGLFGVWLQAMVLTAIGVFAGTFLSWPVALLTTIFFFVAGEVAFAFLLDFSRQSLLGGGPFESLIRLLSHDNQMTELSPTLAVVTAKTLDSIVMPVMSRLVYIVPNFSALDVSNTVADGFEVRWGLLGTNLLLALAYALPFSIAGYFILKNREVAA
jgi:hypothetical protein